MARKDCGSLEKPSATEGTCRLRFARVGAELLMGVAVVFGGRSVEASTIRVWRSATVTGQVIRIDDVCDLSDLGDAGDASVAARIVAEAPAEAGSRIIHMDLVRDALREAGVNMAAVRLYGAMRCEVTRPAIPARPTRTVADATAFDAGKTDTTHPSRTTRASSIDPSSSSAAAARRRASNQQPSLRGAVADYFTKELARYGGRVEIEFDGASSEVLDLSGPTFSFRVRQGNRRLVGLTSIQVEILSAGKRVQVVPLVARVHLVRDAIMAKRSINLGATIKAADLRRVETAFSRLDRLGLEDEVLAVGQRAKRFVPVGTMLDASMLESVPLVLRGQLVNLVSVAGGVRIVTSARSAEEGLLGAVVRVRSTSRSQNEFNGVVVGPGTVQIGVTVPRFVASAGLSESLK